MKDKKIAIIGFGNLGRAILRGLLEDKDFPASNVTVTKRDLSTLTDLKDTGIKMTSDNAEAIKTSELVVIALMPDNLLEITESLKTHFDGGKHIVVSLAAGIYLEELENAVGSNVPVFRAMPNTAADIGESLTCICTNSTVQEDRELVKQFFDKIGSTIEVGEDLMEAATVLGACGIAYVLRFIRAMAQGGIQIGFDAKTAVSIVNQTVKGAAQLLIERDLHPEDEIDKVTTPKGCTIAGLNEMEHNGFSSALIKGIMTSFTMIEK